MKWWLLALSIALPAVFGIFGGMSAPYVIASALSGLWAFFAGVVAMNWEQ